MIDSDESYNSYNLLSKWSGADLALIKLKIFYDLVEGPTR